MRVEGKEIKVDGPIIRALTKTGIVFVPKLKADALLTDDGTRFEAGTRHRPAGFMPLGAYSYCRALFGPVDRIGRYCSIASGVSVMGDDHPTGHVSTSPVLYSAQEFQNLTGHSSPSPLPDFKGAAQPITIGDDVWIGQDVLLRGGISIGTGTVIAARAVVTRDVVPYAIVGGVPARVIRMRFSEPLIAALLKSCWWDYAARDLAGLPLDRPEAFCDALAAKVAAGLKPMPEQRRTISEHIAVLR